MRSLLLAVVMFMALGSTAHAQGVPASGDQFANAPTVGAPSLLLVDTRNASIERGEPAPACLPAVPAALRRTVWYRVVPSTASLTVSTAGNSTGFRPVFALYSGASLADLAPVACSDQWTLRAPVVPGQAYYLQVGGAGLGVGADGGAFTVILGPAELTLSGSTDSLPPSVSMSALAADPTNVSPVPVTVIFSESVTGFAAGDVTPGNATISNFVGGGASYTFSLIPSGQGLVTADIGAGVAVDGAGNPNTAAAQFSRFFDAIPPTTTATARSGGVSAVAYDSGTWTNQIVSVSLTSVDDSSGAGVREIVYSASGAQGIPTTTVVGASTGSSPIAIASEGTTLVSFAGTDNAGNTEAAKTFAVRLDMTAPTSTIALDPAAPTGSNGWHTGDVTVLVAAADGSGTAGVAQVRCALDPVSIPLSFDELPDPAAAPCAFAASGGGVLSAEGQHVLYAAAVDAAGNKEAPKSLAIKLDKTAPSAAAGGPYTVAEGASVPVAASGTDAVSGPVAFSWDLDGNGTFETTGQTAAFTGLDGPATPTITVRVVNQAGLAAVATATVSVQNLPPSISAVTNNGPVDEGVSATITVSASDPAGALDPLAYSFDCDNNGTYEVGPQSGSSAVCAFPDDGSFTVKVQVADDDGGTATSSTSVVVRNVAPSVTASAASATVQYGDAVTPITITARDVTADLPLVASSQWSKDGGATQAGLPSGISLTANSCAPTGLFSTCAWTLGGTADVPSGTYALQLSVGDSDGAVTPTTITILVQKEQAEVRYAGDMSVFTAGPTITTAPVRLAAVVTQVADGQAGDLTRAAVTFELYRASNLTNTPDQRVAGVPVDAGGNALTTISLGEDAWRVTVMVDAANQYWTSPADTSVLNVALGTTDRRVVGGGWVPDYGGRGSFAFTVNYQRNGNPRGNSIFHFRGADGFDYLVKSNSWQGGELAFFGDPAKASFSGRAVVQKIDRATGAVADSYGNHTYTVDLLDGDLTNPQQTDRYAITVLDTSGAAWHRVGAVGAPTTIGGGNVRVQSK